MPSLRTKSISTKVTDEEYAQFEVLAGEQTISEWARDVLLKATKPNAGEQTVLAEVLALRTILLNVHFAVSQGQTLTAEDMRQLFERADQNKLSKAQERLAEAATGGVPCSRSGGDWTMQGNFRATGRYGLSERSASL